MIRQVRNTKSSTVFPRGTSEYKAAIKNNRGELYDKFYLMIKFAFKDVPTRYEDIQEAIKYIAKLNIKKDIGSKSGELEKFVTYCKNLDKELTGYRVEESSYLKSSQDKSTLSADVKALKSKFADNELSRNGTYLFNRLYEVIGGLSARGVRIKSEIKLPTGKSRDTVRENREGLLERFNFIYEESTETKYEDMQEAIRWIANLDVETDIGSTDPGLKNFVAYCGRLTQLPTKKTFS